MTTSALRMMLTHTPEQAKVIGASIQSGELLVGDTLKNDPSLFVDFIHATGDWRNANSQRRVSDMQEQAELAKLLVERGAKPWLAIEGKVDAFEKANQIGNHDLVQWLGQHQDAPANLTSRKPAQQYTESYLQNATAETTKALLGLGFDPHVRIKDGGTLLHFAHGAQALELLLQAGVDPTLKNNKGLDAKTHWDQQRLQNEVRTSVDAVFARHLPTDHNRLIREFGKQWLEVGPTISKQRLKDAGIDPISAQVDGIGLVERVVGEALRLGMRREAPSSSSYSPPLGDPMAHRKWRKLMLSAMRLCQVSGANADAKGQQVLDTLELYLAIDRLLQNPITNPLVMAGKKTKPDETRAELRAAIGPERRAGFNEQISAHIEVIKRLTKTGVIDNGAMVAGWLLRQNMATTSWAKWMERGGQGETLFMRLGRLATAEFDPGMKGSNSMKLEAGNAGYYGMTLPGVIPAAFAQEKNGVGVMAIIAARTRQNAPKEWLLQQLDKIGDISLTPEDPWLMHGIELLGASKEKMHQLLAQELGTMAQVNILQQETPVVETRRRGPRL